MTPEYLSVPPSDLRPNTWNPNKMDAALYRKARKSIQEFGFVDPITVRENPASTPFEIIDGENRWRAAIDENLQAVDIANLGDVPDSRAEKLTIILNELRGTYDPAEMGQLLTRLVAVEPIADLAEVLPFSVQEIGELAALPAVDWATVGRDNSKVRSDQWAERVYRLPTEDARRLDNVIQQIRNQEGVAAYQALMVIVEHYERTG